MTGNLNYWYDAQIRRYLIQLVRVFSNFQVMEQTADGPYLNRVPARYADASRMVASMMRNNSENTLMNAPMITVGIQSIQPARDRSQDPFLADTQQVAEREWNADGGYYTSDQGNLYTTKRYMPVPYNLTIQVDIWTTNTDTKLQILEQIMVIFNPSIQLQSNNNPLDWSNVFEVEMTDTIWSSRSIPVGTEDTMDVSTMTFSVPIWISPPAKVQRQKIIQQIINDIHNTDSVAGLETNAGFYDFFELVPEDSQLVVAPGDYRVHVENGEVQLLNLAGVAQEWQPLIEMIGELSDASKLELNISNNANDRTEIVIGRVLLDELDATKLILNVDVETLQSNTLDNVDRIVDPRASRPAVQLPPPVPGSRYLITEDISVAYPEWNINATANDILEWDGSQWFIAFNASAATQQHWIQNSYTGEQYHWDGNQWISSWQGTYNPGFWRLLL